MSDARLERLTQLARKAWPGMLLSVRRDALGDVLVEHEEAGSTYLEIGDHLLALAAAEAALCVLANDHIDPPVEEFQLEQLIGEDGAASLLPGVRKALDAFLSFEHGCFVSMKHNAQRMREQCQRERERAEKAEAQVAEGERAFAMSWRRTAYALVDRELRARGLTVCTYEHGDWNMRADHYTSLWEGEEQDGWSLLQAVDALKVKP